MGRPPWLDAMWQALPKWVRIVTLVVGVPAWLTFVVSGCLAAEDVQRLSFAIFFAVALLQVAFAARALWRMDL